MQKPCFEKEYGGYLPLELKKGREYFDHIPDLHIRRYNCGRTALYALAETSLFKQVHIPYFICNTVFDALRAQGVCVKRYHVDESFRPVGVDSLADGEAILLVNYFGLMTQTVYELQNNFTSVILDNTQAFFCPPVLRPGVSNVYSCRKFVGVPDGGYLIAQDCTAPQYEAGTSWEAYSFLCKAHEEGTNAAYGENLKNEERLGIEKTGMSALTRMVLQSAPYDDIKLHRQRNFARLEKRLGQRNQLKLPLGDQVPYLYPYWATTGTGTKIRQELLKQHVYVPTLWKECLDSCRETDLEYQWARDLIFLPVDQRYRPEDMETIADMLQEIEE